MTEHSLLEGAAFFTAVHMRIEHATKKAVEKSARLVQKEAKRVLGTYDYDWPKLQPETIARKATGDSPLLETGAMRRSIKWSVQGDRLNWTAYVGSNDPKALWHELGTRHIPPRSFLAGAAMRKEHEVHIICGHDLFHHVFSQHPDFEDEWSYDGED